MGRVAALALVMAAATLAAAASAAASPAPEAVAYRAPVDAPLADPFRAPSSPRGAGNRGVDYTTTPGTAVVASAGGQVVFAGRVGTGIHVVVLHADGLRTSYSFLAALAVRRGEPVEAGQVVGRAGPSLHFGARAGEAYLDPLVLLSDDDAPLVHLVPDGERAMGSEADERRALVGLLRGAGRAAGRVGRTAVSWAAGAADAVVSDLPTVEELEGWSTAAASMAAAPWRLSTGAWQWWRSRHTCTPASVEPPPLAGRRRLVLVGGLGSTSRSAAVDEVDTVGLGYAPGDVVRFSYRGGTTRERPYAAADTQVDIRESGRRLRELLERLAADDPGVPIDVVAHSQGGLVARSALGARAPPGVASLVTLGTPHRGADVATAVALLGQTGKGAAALAALARSGLTDIDPTSTSVSQLSEASAFIRELAATPLPPEVRVTSIAARADVAVASPRARLSGAANVVVSVPDVNDHADLPGSDVAHREVALALAGRASTCESLGDFVLDAVTGEVIGTAEDAAGIWLTVQAAPGAPPRARPTPSPSAP